MGIDSRAFDQVYNLNLTGSKIQNQKEAYKNRIAKLKAMEATTPEDQKKKAGNTNQANQADAKKADAERSSDSAANDTFKGLSTAAIYMGEGTLIYLQMMKTFGIL